MQGHQEEQVHSGEHQEPHRYSIEVTIPLGCFEQPAIIEIKPDEHPPSQVISESNYATGFTRLSILLPRPSAKPERRSKEQTINSLSYVTPGLPGSACNDHVSKLTAL